ncbi:MAG: 3-hydroxyacyl-ACP dehydratase FabZ [Nitrospinae bacterium]|nr:3-hydroxyacyl-ACP dehydratase FabZ [Nitrospinota bacterium]
MDEIFKAIPHREPFLFVDQVLERTDTLIRTRKKADPEAGFFKGHFPDYPIMPGVLICEAVFQSGAILMSARADSVEGKVPVLTRISNVKFKHGVFPGDVMEIVVEHKETVGPAHYMKGKVMVEDKIVSVLEFAVMLVEEAK